jgi:hypothetical protein
MKKLQKRDAIFGVPYSSAPGGTWLCQLFFLLREARRFSERFVVARSFVINQN